MDIEKYSKIAPQHYTGEVPQLLVDLLKNNKFDNILDCGCGDGSLIYGLIKRKLLGHSVIEAIDLSKNRIKLVKKISSKVNARVDSVETLKTIKTNSVDLLISTQVIEHVDDMKMSNAMKRVTKKGGIIYLSTVLKKWYGWYFYRNEIGWVLDPTHLREYSNDNQLIKILNNNFWIVSTNKTLQRFPLADFIVKRVGIIQKKKDTYIWKLIRSIRLPILGYYNWELVLVRK